MTNVAVACQIGNAARPERNARILLACAMLVNLLLFVRVAVVYQPFLSYEAPVGADPVFYYAYTRSLVIDHDLDLANEIAMRPPSSGLLVEGGLSKYPVGTSLLSVPAFAVTHLVLTTLRAAGVGVQTDGYSPPYAMAYVLSQMAAATVGMWLLYLALRRYLAPMPAAAGVVAAWLTTNVLHAAAVQVNMSHAAALFSIGWCSYEALSLTEPPHILWKWARLGASCGFVILVRYQNALFLLVPLVIVARTLWDHRVPLEARMLRVGTAAVAGMAMLLIQMSVWKHGYGSWVVNSYNKEFSFSWLHPHLGAMLTSPSSGLQIWLPALVISLGACAVHAVRRRDPVAACALAAFAANLYVNASWWAWDLVLSRSTFDMILPVALGFGLIMSAAKRLRLVGPAGVLMIVLACWNVPFAALGPPSAGEGSLVDGWAWRVQRLVPIFQQESPFFTLRRVRSLAR